MDDLEDNSSTTDDAPLTLSEAVKAITATKPADDVDTDQAEADEAQEGEADEDLPAEEEGEDEEGDGAEEEQAEEGDEDEEAESDQGRFVSDTGKVRLDDGRVVSIADLKKGTLLHADYTRKTQEVADARRAVDAQSTQNKQLQQQLAEQRDYVAKLIQSIVPEMPGPEMLAKDPQGYLEQRAQAEQWAEHLKYLTEQTQRDHKARQAEVEKGTKERLAKEWTSALDKMPELSDPKRLEAFGKDTVKYGGIYGYSPEDMSRIHHDHRQLLVFKDAIAWRKLQEKRKAEKPAPKGNERPPVMKGGTRLNPKAAKERKANAAMERLNKSGSLQDGVAAYLARQKG